MLALLLLQMAYVLTGQRFHEWSGTVMILFVLIHNILNRRWYGSVGKGSYQPKRLAGTVLTILVLAVIAALFVSGVVMSRYVFRFLPVHGGRALARKVHIACAYWGFLLIAVHFGMHWNGIWKQIKKRVGWTKVSAARRIITSIVVTVVSVYGIYAFFQHEILSFLLFRNEYAFFVERPLILFLIDYLAILVLIVNLARYTIETGKK